ncbi:hypothetical protein A33M_3574 [Rhodovulum sp. PH10]|nr:hypothetical protein A33M_3574 [Rhodovulum sp. PH10]
MLQALLIGLLALLGTLLAGAWSLSSDLNSRIGDLKTETAVIGSSIVSIDDRLSKIEKTLDGLRDDAVHLREGLARVETRLSTRDAGPTSSDAASGKTPATGSTTGGR